MLNKSYRGNNNFNSIYTPANDDEQITYTLKKQREMVEGIKTDYWNSKQLIEKLNGENRDLRNELNNSTRVNSEMLTAFERQKFEMEEANKQLATENFYQREELKRFEIIFDESTKSINIWKHECEMLKNDLESRIYGENVLHGRVNDLQNDLENMKSREIELLSEISRLKTLENLLAERNHHNMTLEGVCEDLTKELEITRNSKSDITKDNKMLQIRFEEIDNENSKNLSHFESNVDVLKNDLKQYYEFIQNQEKCISSLK